MITPAPVHERLLQIQQVCIEYPRMKRLLALIEECHEDSRYSLEPQCLLLTGDTGTGKSTLVSQYLKKYPRRQTSEGSIISVFHAAIPAQASIKGVVTRLLSSLGDPSAGRGTTVNQTYRLYKLIENCKVELIILDEFQHLIDENSQQVLNTVANWVKSLINETRVPVVLIGMPWSNTILLQNPQLRRRFMVNEVLSPFQWGDSESAREFRLFLLLLDRALPFNVPSNLWGPEIAFRFFVASQGVIAHLMSLARRAATIAVKSSAESITLEHLSQAFKRQIGTDFLVPGDPFSAPLSEVAQWEKKISSHSSASGSNWDEKTSPTADELFS